MASASDPEIERRKAAMSAFKRELIREAAKRVFVKVGLHETSVREIAKAADTRPEPSMPSMRARRMSMPIFFASP